ncbi:MAG: DUF748 domain-containing protein [Bacteroidota bacterium]|nr:DUF748 domain-containing protein [Bacteroidota bacterium]
MRKFFKQSNKTDKKSKAPRWRRWVIWLLVIFIAIPALIIIFISPITKYVVEKYDVKYIGREITMDWAYVNPFTGYLHFDNFKVYENKSDSLFLSTDGLSAHFSARKFFSKDYEIRGIEMEKPHITIVMTEKKINLDDIIQKFAGDTIGPKKEGVHFSINSIIINDGVFRYRENTMPIDYYIKEVNIQCSGLRWNTDSIAGSFSFVPGIGNGKMKGHINLDYKTLNYELKTVVENFNLDFIGQYFKAIANYGSFAANLDADIHATGNFKRAEDLVAKGLFQLSDFHFGKDTSEDYCSFDKFVVQINELSPKNHKYMFDSLILYSPFFKYERYDHLDNVQTMFGQKGANLTAANANPAKFNLVIEIGNYVKLLSRNFFASYYQVKRLAVYNGNLIYNDYTLDEKFSIAANPMNIIADSIDKNHPRVKLNFESGIMPYGHLKLDLSINPKDSTDFDLSYHFDKFAVPMLNPFIIKYTSFATDRGAIELSGNWHVRNSIISSNNHLIILDPRIAFRVRNEDSKYVPLRLIMAFVRESGNVIDYEIPIQGNLKDPKFKLMDVITDVIANIFIKPVTTPYRIQVKRTEEKIEKSISLRWYFTQSRLEESQEKFVKKMAEFLKDNPDATITVAPVNYEIKEKESILLFEAKKQYYIHQHKITAANFTEDDSVEVEYLSIKDSGFVKYLNRHVTDSLVFTIQGKCAFIVSNNLVNTRYNQLQERRKKEFMFYFKENGTNSRVKFKAGESSIPINGFSHFKIEYKGELPRSLEKAYDELSTLNGENPRRKYLRLRTKYNRMLERKLRKEN